MIDYKVKHYYQPTNNSCSQSATAILLSHYGYNLSPQEIMQKIPVNKDEDGNDWGTIIQNIATWIVNEGFNVHMYTADFQVLDLNWANLDKKELISRMQALKGERNIPVLGKDWSRLYMESYIEFIEAGGKLSIVPYISSGLIDELLAKGPLLTNVCYNVMYNSGRSRNTGLRQSVKDDLNGRLTNHSIVIYGKDADGNYLVADPLKKPGRLKIDKETLIVGIAAAQLECDNLIVSISKKVN